jgi:hypothetical protein
MNHFIDFCVWFSTFRPPQKKSDGAPIQFGHSMKHEYTVCFMSAMKGLDACHSLAFSISQLQRLKQE